MRLPSVCLAVVLLAGCNNLTQPRDEQVVRYEAPVAATPEPAPTPPPAPTPAPTPPPPPREPMLHAAHILVAYKGAMRADEKIVRSKDDAKKLAEQLAKRAAKEKFDDLAKKYSDDKGSGSKGGDLGEFAPSQMVKPFADATIALKPNTISGVVESPFGFHVIKRLP